MGDTQNFELLLKKSSNKRQNTLYSVCKQQKQCNIRPEEVISSVSSQIKAIHASELKFERGNQKCNIKCSNSRFLSVNKLPTYGELPATKFDTQCVTDTQLIDLIENAEHLHQKGITQEFESTFHHKDKLEVDKILDSNEDSETIDDVNTRDPTNEKTKERDKDISPSSINIMDKCSENLFEESIIIQQEIHKNDDIKETKEFDENIIDVHEEINDIDKEERDEANLIINQCIVEESAILERPISPIFVHKNSKQKSNTPSPLIFNLEKFEQFENLVIPLINSNSLKTTKTVINSQILNKELHINMDKEVKIQVNEQNIAEEPIIESLTPTNVVLNAKHGNSLKLPERDKAAFKVSEENQSQVLKDEILFSSDDESYKEDLPFTCALETSFYNQSGVLDKTVYVGFQTASNKSILVDKESFVKARSILSDVNEGISITELVNNCDSYVKDKNEDAEATKPERNGNKTHSESSKTVEKFNKSDNLDSDAKNLENYALLSSTTNMNKEHKEIISTKDTQKQLFQGFVTANNKAIKLSDKGLARCKKVFQDIDLEQNFNNEKCLDELDNGTKFYEEVTKDIDIVTNESKGLFINEDRSNEYNTVKKVAEVLDTDSNAKIEVQNIITDTQMVFDDALIKELENIEMSLRDKQGNNNTVNIDEEVSNKTVDKASTVSKDIFKDTILKDTTTIKENYGIRKNYCVLEFKGFQTASNKNISISKEALEKSRNLFQDIDAVDLVKHNDKSIDCYVNMPNLTFTKNTDIGFKTASNKGIHISNNALSKVKNIFKDISSEEFKLPLKDKATAELYPESAMNNDIVGFRTASNKNINVSKQALNKVKHILKDIDDLPRETENDDFICSKFKDSKNKDPYPDITESISNESISKAEDIIQAKIPTKLASLKQSLKSVDNKSSESKSFIKSAFMGFQTANNKKVPISFESLQKTKYIFKDIDSMQNTDSKEPIETKSNEGTMEKEVKDSKHKDENLQGTKSKSVFKGFHTADNKVINISEESLIQSKAIFKDLDLADDVSNMKSKTRSVNDKIQTVHNKLVSEKPFIGFKTANNTNIVISEAALTKTKDIFKDIDSPNFLLSNKTNVPEEILTVTDNINRPFMSKTSFVGFKTGNNKVIKVSDAALAKTKVILQQVDTSDFVIPKNQISDYPNIEKSKNKLEIVNETAKVNGLSTKSHTFQGFQTASNKQVKISADALAKTRDIFKDLDKTEESNKLTAYRNDLADDNYAELLIKRKASPVFKGFATASNKRVLISEDSLAKAKKLLQDSEINKEIVDLNDKNSNKQEIIVSKDNLGKVKRLFSEINASKTVDTNKRVKNESQGAIENIIDTQVLNDFEESLNTGDFIQTSKQSKRSGSPILSCPRAKKRKKFEIPYSQNKVLPSKAKVEEKEKNGNIFDENYKKEKKYTLKDLLNMTKDVNKTTDTYFEQFDYTNLLNFEFDRNRNDVTSTKISVPELKELFLTNVNRKLVPNGWFENHIRLILWKLMSYEIKFQFGMVCDVKNVLGQLKYRFDKELYDAKRPALRKIMEKDDLPSKTMVLCVAEIYMDDISVTSVTNLQGNIELSLTDGWYCIRTVIDKMLSKLVFDGKICVGTKLVTTGAELVNCEQGVSPWEDTSLIRLKIFGNSTRRARWDARLGYHGNGAILSRLSHVALSGGKVAKLRVFVTRVYPPLYVDKFEDGSTVTRSERLEHIHQAKVEAERQIMMERIYEEVEKEFADQESQDSEGLSDPGAKRTYLDSGSQISKLMKRSKDPGEFKATLTSSQTTLLDNYTSKKRDLLLEDIQNRMRQKMEKEGVCIKRNVVMLLKIRVADVIEKSGVDVVKGMMSIWKPTDAVLDIIKEGAWIDVMNVIPTALRYSEIQLSAGRQTIFNSSKFKESVKVKPFINLLKRKSYIIKDLTQNPQMITDYNEIDTAGLIFLIDPSIKEFDSSKQQFQNIFLADENKNIICINFWGGLTKFGYQNVLDTDQVIFCGNLQKRAGNTRKSIPQYRVTELSYFTKTPKYEGARILVGDLNKKFMSLDRRKFCEDCVVLKKNYSNFKQNNENMSPYRFNTSDFNISKNKFFIESPLLKQSKKDDIFNLTGLDFESTFKQTDSQHLSEELLERKKKVNEKIAKLKRYGEPPPLSPLHIINKSKNATSSYKSPLLNENSSKLINAVQKSKNATSSYKSPLLNENSSKLINAVQNSVHSKSDSCINVANVENTPKNCGKDDVHCSPILNKTYVKNVNPVKINFDVKDNDSRIDYFAEDFDGSPPLSLD